MPCTSWAKRTIAAASSAPPRRDCARRSSRTAASRSFTIRWATCCRTAARCRKPIQSYRRAIRLKPDSAEPHNDLGTAYFAQGDAARAAEAYLQAARLRPDHAIAQANLGSVYRKLGLAREARRALQREFLLRVYGALRKPFLVRRRSDVQGRASRTGARQSRACRPHRAESHRGTAQGCRRTCRARRGTGTPRRKQRGAVEPQGCRCAAAR